jgi:hypothetical protein
MNEGLTPKEMKEMLDELKIELQNGIGGVKNGLCCMIFLISCILFIMWC